MRSMLSLVAVLSTAPAWAQTDIGSADLGVLGSATGMASFGEAASYDAADEQRYRFTFATAKPGTLTVFLNYGQEIRSPLEEICPDPDDPNSCFVQPTGAYEDLAGVRLTRFVLTPSAGSAFEATLPEDFIDSLTGERPGRGYDSFGFDTIFTSFELENPLAIGAGSFTADLYGYGLIRGPSFDGDGGGTVTYAFDFAAVPEPTNWALMIAGFGLAGAGLRWAQRDGLRMVPA